MKYRKWAIYTVVFFPLYVVARTSLSVPTWLDLLMGAIFGVLILPVLYFRSSAAAGALIILFLLAFPSLFSMELGLPGHSGLLFLFMLWVILILVIVFDRVRKT
jgi:hypothetical protein